MSVSCEFCVLSGRGLCVGPIICTEKSYRLCVCVCVCVCLIVCDRQTSAIRRPWPTLGCCAKVEEEVFYVSTKTLRTTANGSPCVLAYEWTGGDPDGICDPNFTSQNQHRASERKLTDYKFSL